MEDLEDELDLRYHKGLDPDCYYKCPTTESLDGALQIELERSASNLIPTSIITEFIFAATSSITVPVTLQPQLESLIQPADFLQSITVQYALCRDIDGKDRLRVQRAFARSILEAIQSSDGFKYVERHAQSKEGGDGTRLKYVCVDSLQNRKSNKKKEKSQKNDESNDIDTETESAIPPAFDCGGAIHVKFSLKREAINVVYRHNPIHSRPMCNTNDDSNLPALATDHHDSSEALPETLNGKKKHKKKDEIEMDDEFRGADLDMSTSPEAPKSLTRKRKSRSGFSSSPESSRKSAMKKGKKSKMPQSPSQLRKKTTFREPSPPPRLMKGKACIRCREKKIKCDEAKPTCNQCRRGLWTCQYDVPGAKKRSKHGCLNCKQRKRKCKEERPSCAHCLRLDDDCEYGDDS